MNEAYARRLADSYLSLNERAHSFTVNLGSKQEAEFVSTAFRQRGCSVTLLEENSLSVFPGAKAAPPMARHPGRKQFAY